MSYDNSRPPAEAILSDQERLLCEAFQVHYSGEAKLAVAGLAEALGASPEARDEMVSGLAAQLDEQELNFEDRRNIALGLRWLTSKLGGAAIGTGPPLELPGAPQEGESGDTTPSPADELLETIAQVGLGTITTSKPDILTEATATASAFEPTVPDPIDNETDSPENDNPLLDQQRQWLARLLPEEAIIRIEALPVYQRLDFASKLGTLYQGFSIRRLGPDAKKQRAEQMVALMGGKTYKEIAALTNSKPALVRAGLSNMTESIAKKIGYTETSIDEIVAMIPKRKNTEPTGQEFDADTEIEQRPLSKTQKSWYRKLLEGLDDRETILDDLNPLTKTQQEYIAERLARYLRSYIITKEGQIKTNRRVEQMSLLITGASTEQIAETVGLPVASVKKDLHSSVGSLSRRTPEVDLLRIISDTLNLPSEFPDENRTSV